MPVLQLYCWLFCTSWHLYLDFYIVSMYFNPTVAS